MLLRSGGTLSPNVAEDCSIAPIFPCLENTRGGHRGPFFSAPVRRLSSLTYSPTPPLLLHQSDLVPYTIPLTFRAIRSQPSDGAIRVHPSRPVGHGGVDGLSQGSGRLNGSRARAHAFFASARLAFGRLSTYSCSQPL